MGGLSSYISGMLDWFRRHWFRRHWFRRHWFRRHWFRRHWFRRHWFRRHWFRRHWFRRHWFRRHWFRRHWFRRHWFAGIDTTPRARSVVGWCPGSDPIGLATAMWSVDVRPAAGGVEAPTAGPDGLVGTLRDPLAEENRTHVRLN